jgi:hypothetical protein
MHESAEIRQDLPDQVGERHTLGTNRTVFKEKSMKNGYVKEFSSRYLCQQIFFQGTQYYIKSWIQLTSATLKVGIRS